MAWTTPGTAVAGDVLTASFWNQQVRDNANALYSTIRQLGYTQRTSQYATTATTIATATNVFSSSITFTADGTSRYLVEFSAPLIVQPASNDSFMSINLTDGGNNAFGALGSIGVTNADTNRIGVTFRTYYQFTSGSKTVNVRGVVGSGTGTIECGSGGTGIYDRFPAYLAIYGPALS